MNFPVYSSDDRAKFLQNNNPELIQEITALFGEEAYINGKLNTSFLAEKIFSDHNLKQALNALVHPRVKEDFELWLQQQKAPCVFQESALIYEINRESFYDKVILVTAPLNVRIDRVMKRDQVSYEAVEQRIQNQLSDEEKRLRGPYELINDDQTPMLPQLLHFLEAHTCFNP